MGQALTSPVRHTLPCYIQRDGLVTSDGVFLLGLIDLIFHNTVTVQTAYWTYAPSCSGSAHTPTPSIQTALHLTQVYNPIVTTFLRLRQLSPVQSVSRTLVSRRVFEEVLLVIFFSVIPRTRRSNLRDDFFGHKVEVFRLYLCCHAFCDDFLFGRVEEDGRAIFWGGKE